MVRPLLTTRCHPARSGFTLLEIMLVLAVLVTVAAISWPYFEGWFQSHRLRDGVDKVRTHWIQGRTRAMEEGRPYRFVIYGPTNYKLAPDSPDHWPDLAGQMTSTAYTGNGYPYGLVIDDSPLKEEQDRGVLPNGVRFVGWMDGQLDAGAGGTTLDLSSVSIIFWPDGTARISMLDGVQRPDVQLLITDQQEGGRMTALHLRGLTGVVTVYNVGGSGYAPPLAP